MTVTTLWSEGAALVPPVYQDQKGGVRSLVTKVVVNPSSSTKVSANTAPNH